MKTFAVCEGDNGPSGMEDLLTTFSVLLCRDHNLAASKRHPVDAEVLVVIYPTPSQVNAIVQAGQTVIAVAEDKKTSRELCTTKAHAVVVTEHGLAIAAQEVAQVLKRL